MISSSEDRATIWRWFGPTLFFLSFVIYAYVSLSRLDEFPVNFFSDEAVQTTNVESLIENNFRDSRGNFLPTYFPVAWNWNISLSVYLQIPGYLLFGKTIDATRAAPAIVCLLTPIFIALIMRHIFKVRWWWLSALVLILMPTWFLHSRSALECSLTAPFLAGFMWFYMRYRQGDGRSRELYLAVLFAALTFYSRSTAQAFLLFTGMLLLLSDLPHHWRNRKIVLKALMVALILALPYARFRIQHPDVIKNQFEKMDSYLVKPISTQEKLATFWQKYSYGMSPQYWFFSDDELVRHRLKGYGHIQPIFFVPFILGLIVCLKNFKSSAHRLVLITLLVSPIPSALIEIMVGRIITIFVPIAIMMILGIEVIKDLLAKFFKHGVEPILATGCVAACAMLTFNMYHDALKNGPLWFDDYGLYGVQWGAKQLFTEELPDYYRSHRHSRIFISPDWANGTDVFLRFFDVPPNVSMVSLNRFILHQTDIPQDSTFIVTPSEYERAQDSKKFVIEVEKTLKYPNGKDGFYFLKLRYVDDVESVFAEEKERRRQLLSKEVSVNGPHGEERISVKYSQLDMGEIDNVFDDSSKTIARGMEANPFIVEVALPNPRAVNSISCIVQNSKFAARGKLFSKDGSELAVFAFKPDAENPDHASAKFSPPVSEVSSYRVEVSNPTIAMDEPANIHLANLELE